jgi:hypothetical protein
MRQSDASLWLLMEAERHTSGNTDALSTAFRRPMSASLAPMVKDGAGPSVPSLGRFGLEEPATGRAIAVH